MVTDIETLRKEISEFVAKADEESLQRLHNVIHDDETDWWDELPDEVKGSIEEGIRESNAGGEGVTWEEFKSSRPQWFPG